jgi:prevent-host-death family protein
MTIQVNIADAKARLSELIDLALQSEEVVLARAGKPVARIVMAASPAQRSNFFGALAHLGPVPDDALTPEPLDALYDFDDDIVPSYPIAAEREHVMLTPKGT